MSTDNSNFTDLFENDDDQGELASSSAEQNDVPRNLPSVPTDHGALVIRHQAGELLAEPDAKMRPEVIVLLEDISRDAGMEHLKYMVEQATDIADNRALSAIEAQAIKMALRKSRDETSDRIGKFEGMHSRDNATIVEYLRQQDGITDEEVQEAASGGRKMVIGEHQKQAADTRRLINMIDELVEGATDMKLSRNEVLGMATVQKPELKENASQGEKLYALLLTDEFWQDNNDVRTRYENIAFDQEWDPGKYKKLAADIYAHMFSGHMPGRVPRDFDRSSLPDFLQNLGKFDDIYQLIYQALNHRSVAGMTATKLRYNKLDANSAKRLDGYGVEGDDLAFFRSMQDMNLVDDPDAPVDTAAEAVDPEAQASLSEAGLAEFNQQSGVLQSVSNWWNRNKIAEQERIANEDRQRREQEEALESQAQLDAARNEFASQQKSINSLHFGPNDVILIQAHFTGAAPSQVFTGTGKDVSREFNQHCIHTGEQPLDVKVLVQRDFDQALQDIKGGVEITSADGSVVIRTTDTNAVDVTGSWTEKDSRNAFERLCKTENGYSEFKITRISKQDDIPVEYAPGTRQLLEERGMVARIEQSTDTEDDTSENDSNDENGTGGGSTSTESTDSTPNTQSSSDSSTARPNLRTRLADAAKVLFGSKQVQPEG